MRRRFLPTIKKIYEKAERVLKFNFLTVKAVA